MKKTEWKNKYINILIEAGLSKEKAEINYESGIDCFDYDDDPEDAANDALFAYFKKYVII